MARLRHPFNMKIAERIYFLAAKGFTDEEISYSIGVSHDTLQRWKKSPRFASMLEKSKGEVDDKVENSLLRRALGYKYTERSEDKKQIGFTTDEKGKQVPNFRITQHIVEKEMPPSDVACMFWLKNRRRDKWRNDFVDFKSQTLVINASDRARDEKLIGSIRNELATRFGITFQPEGSL